MQKVNKTISRRQFIKAAGVTGVVSAGILAFPAGTELVESFADGAVRVSRMYSSEKIGRVADLADGHPVDFSYPSGENQNFLVKLGTPAKDGVGPAGDIVAFNYLCTHMGCPLTGQYNHQYKMMGPCPCHYSRFDLSKSGIMIMGQATQSLPQILLKTREGMIYATGVTGIIYGLQNNLKA